jgi:hypothetical protein
MTDPVDAGTMLIGQCCRGYGNLVTAGPGKRMEHNFA